jgi:hypothetical protein
MVYRMLKKGELTQIGDETLNCQFHPVDEPVCEPYTWIPHRVGDAEWWPEGQVRRPISH